MNDINKKCYLCSGEDVSKICCKVRDDNFLDVLRCKNCSFEFLSSFNHIDELFYNSGKMHKKNFSFEKWLQASQKDDLRRFKLLKAALYNKNVLDFGCGAGGFLKLASCVAKSVSGVEKHENLNKFLSDANISIYDDIASVSGKYDVITMFHVLEHLKDPKNTVLSLKSLLAPDGLLIIEIPSSDDALLSLYKCSAFADFWHWRCHLYYFNRHTVKLFASQLNLKINYIKQIQRYGFSNHLYWLVKGKKGGHNKWSKLDFVDFFYIPFLKLINKTDTLFICLSDYT